MQMGFDNLHPNVAAGERLSAPPNSVAAVRDAAAIGARADRGHGGSTADRGLRPRQAGRRDDADADVRPDEPPRAPALAADLDAVPDEATPTGDHAATHNDRPAPAHRPIAVLEPESSALMAARRAYTAGIMLTRTRGQTIPAGAVLDGTV